MKASFFKFIIAFFFTVNPVFAMVEDEELSKQTSIKHTQQKTSEEEAPSSGIVTTESCLDELLLTIFKFVEIPDLGRVTQVSIRWKRITETAELWRFMGAKYYGDFLSPEDLSENSKQKVIFHYLSMIVNATENLKQIERLVSLYRLDLYVPLFKEYMESAFLTDLVLDLSDCEGFIAQSNQKVISRKIEGLAEGKYGYEKNPSAAREVIDSLVEKGNLEAIDRKREALGWWSGRSVAIAGWKMIPTYGYEKDPKVEEELNELLVKKGDSKAIKRKIEALSQRHWDKLALEAARELNDFLVEKGDSEAIERKIEKGLFYGKYGYTKDLEAAREFNDFLVEKEDPEAIERKIVALSDAGGHPLPFRGYSVLTNSINVPDCGYKKDPAAAKKLNESLVNKGNPKAIEIKIKGLLGTATGSYSNVDGCFTVNLTYGYKKDPVAAKIFNDSLVAKGNTEAIERKIFGLSNTNYGYEKDPVTAKELNELLVEQENPEAIKRKIESLEKGGFGYEKDPMAAREFNDSLVEKGVPGAIEKKISGFISGRYGYEKDPVAAKEFIESLVISEVPVARAIGKYIKVFAMKYGIVKFGYERNRGEAFKFIRENHVPY